MGWAAQFGGGNNSQFLPKDASSLWRPLSGGSLLINCLLAVFRIALSSSLLFDILISN
jgi:hypothetical protein